MTSEPTLGDVLSEVEAAIAAGDHDRAIALTDDLLQSYPDAIGVWRARAEAFDASGRPFQASEAYRRVLDIAPADVNAMRRLALALSHAGQGAEAKLVARQALDYAPEDEALLRIVAARDAEDAEWPEVGAALREGLNDVRAGLFDRGITRLHSVVAQCPDRADALVALAHALWEAGLRVAAAEACQFILDIQPDCLNAHALLLALWRRIGPPGLEQAHLNAIERLDPDHRHVKALLGDDSPLEVVSVPAVRQPSAQSAAEEAEALDRAAWVSDLVAAASSAPKPLERIAQPFSANDATYPLERDDALIAAASGDEVAAAVAGDVVHLHDAAGADDDGMPVESLIPLEWEESDDVSGESGAAASVWLTDAVDAEPGGSVPMPPQPTRPNVSAGGASPEWVANEATMPTWIAQPKPHTPRRGASRASLAGLMATSRAAAAREAINRGRWQEAMSLYEKAIALGRGKALDEVIADLAALSTVQPLARAAHELLGMAYARKGDMNAALQAYRRAMILATEA
ncbi:MAG: hypothetical protein D6709_03090 [Chloroflexi bacterium]|jgi:tetratricopeptide (TPR) repeat protein|uniref:Bacterial transcriptional activator domain-containing protein n=1 Tax=Candidatus Thermofonsia Clade 3 bacterium TaxID=2364212 RepID=A0A2M8QDY1_9CHLR|nr:tetratricopeptide repeat protein [Candidatus Roseilinea sp. NK_OTU-006]PJF47962.1 MAG: hypothetical protein CUN48_05810 [Candidatus Thermofonsia Clade 3 bacterium]RMG65311.1 MAG: hypothetical protein D6709_03090 [Chloroflexota bacterium]